MSAPAGRDSDLSSKIRGGKQWSSREDKGGVHVAREPHDDHVLRRRVASDDEHEEDSGEGEYGHGSSYAVTRVCTEPLPALLSHMPQTDASAGCQLPHTTMVARPRKSAVDGEITFI